MCRRLSSARTARMERALARPSHPVHFPRFVAYVNRVGEAAKRARAAPINHAASTDPAARKPVLKRSEGSAASVLSFPAVWGDGPVTAVEVGSMEMAGERVAVLCNADSSRTNLAHFPRFAAFVNGTGVGRGRLPVDPEWATAVCPPALTLYQMQQMRSHHEQMHPGQPPENPAIPGKSEQTLYVKLLVSHGGSGGASQGRNHGSESVVYGRAETGHRGRV